MDAPHLLATLIAQKRAVAAAQFGSNVHFKALVDLGFVRECGIVQSVLCDECDHPHDAAIVFDEGQYGCYCPDLGFIAQSRADLIAVKPDIGRLVAWLADHLSCKRSKSTPIHGETWRVGTISGDAADVVLYLHPTLRDGHDLQALQDALARETRTQFGVVLTAHGTLSLPPLVTIRLDECLAFDEQSNRFEVDADLLAVAGVPQKNQGGRPSPYADELAKIIARRKSSGKALPGVNAEQRAVLAEFKSIHPTGPHPSRSTISRAIKGT